MSASRATRNPAVRLVQGPGKVLQEENSRTVLTSLTITSSSGEARKAPQFLAAFTATLGALCAGPYFSWTSSVQPDLCPAGLDDPYAQTFAWIGACFPIGAFVGCLFAGAAANRWGRQRTLLLLSPPLLASWVLLSLFRSTACLLVGRLLGGLAVGAVSVVVGMYVSEIAEPAVRGTLGSFFQLQVTVGILLGYIAGLLHDPAHLAYINMLMPVVWAMLFWFMPESPVFLVGRGQSERARDALQWLRGPEYDVGEELAAVRLSTRESQKSKPSVKDLVSSPAALRGIIVALGLMAAQQLSGVNAVIFYATEIFRNSGSSIKSEQSSIIVGIVQVLSTFVSVVLVDRAGRRVLLLLSSSVMAICLATLGVYFTLMEAKHDLKNITWLPLVTIAVFIVMFSLGLGPLPWCVVSEIFSPAIRGTASSVACGFNWFLAFAVTKFFSNLNSLFGNAGTFFVFSACSVLGTIFIALLVPETKGKSLDEILAEMTGRRNCEENGSPDALEDDAEEDEDDQVNKRAVFVL